MNKILSKITNLSKSIRPHLVSFVGETSTDFLSAWMEEVMEFFFSFLGEVFFQRKEEITTICSCIPLCLPELWISSRILWCHCSFLAITQEFIGYFTLMFKKIHTNVKWNQMKYPMNYWVMAKNVCYGHHCEVSVMLTSDLWPPNSNQFILKS